MPANLRINILKSYLAEDPSDSFTCYALALEYFRLGDLDEASILLHALIETDPTYLAAYYQLGLLLERKQFFDEAESIFIRGIEIAKMQSDQRTLSELKEALSLLPGRDADEG